MKTFSSPSGRTYVTVKSARPDPASRFQITISDGFFTSAQGLADLGKWLTALSKEYAKEEATAPDLAETLAPNATGEATINVTTATPTVEVKAAE